MTSSLSFSLIWAIFHFWKNRGGKQLAKEISQSEAIDLFCFHCGFISVTHHFLGKFYEVSCLGLIRERHLGSSCTGLVKLPYLVRYFGQEGAEHPQSQWEAVIWQFGEGGWGHLDCNLNLGDRCGKCYFQRSVPKSLDSHWWAWSTWQHRVLCRELAGGREAQDI